MNIGDLAMAILISTTALLGMASLILVQIRLTTISRKQNQLRLTTEDYNLLYNGMLYSLIFGAATVFFTLLSFIEGLRDESGLLIGLLILSVGCLLLQIGSVFIPTIRVFWPLKKGDNSSK